METSAALAVRAVREVAGAPTRLVFALALAMGGCSLLFEPSQYTNGRRRDGGLDAAGLDAAGLDAARPDAAELDGGGFDAGGGPDGGGSDGGPPIVGALPTCGDGSGSATFMDAQGSSRTITPELAVALFPGSDGSTREAGLVFDVPLPAPSEGQLVDVAVAPGASAGTWLIAGATTAGALRVHVVRLTDAVTVDPALVAVSWGGAPPESIRRIAMRSAGGAATLAVLGEEGGATRGWSCTGSESSFTCALLRDLPDFDSVAVANVGGVLHPLFVDAGVSSGFAYRPSDGASPVMIDTLHHRLSGTEGPLVYAPVRPGDVWVFLLGVESGFARYQIDARRAEGAGGIAWLEGDSYEAIRAIDGDGSFTLDARPVECRSGGCTCPPSPGDCSSAPVVAPLSVTGGPPRALETSAAGDAVLAVVGAGEDATGTDVSLFAFDSGTHAHIRVASDSDRVVLASGMLGPAFVGTLIDDVGLRAAVAASSTRVDVVSAALVDLSAGGAEPTRELFVSALRICRSR